MGELGSPSVHGGAGQDLTPDLALLILGTLGVPGLGVPLLQQAYSEAALPFDWNHSPPPCPRWASCTTRPLPADHPRPRGLCTQEGDVPPGSA